MQKPTLRTHPKTAGQIGNKYPPEQYPACPPAPAPNSKPRPIGRHEGAPLWVKGKLLQNTPTHRDGNKLGMRSRKVIAGITAQ